jgi:sodium transport system permease protein
MITVAWFVALFSPPTPVGIVAGQLGYVLTPPVVLALLLTSSPRRTLRLSWPSWRYLALAAALALTLNPLLMELNDWVEWLFPIPDSVKQQLGAMLGSIPDLPTALLVLAVVPAICEEVAFRGFILSGLEAGHRTRSAILMSALLFGFLHVLVSLFHQLFNATLLGIVLGLLAVRSRSLLPGIVFHMLNNGLAVWLGMMSATAGEGGPAWLRQLYRDPAHLLYHRHWIVLGALASAALLALLVRDPARSPTGPAPEVPIPEEPVPAC